MAGETETRTYRWVLPLIVGIFCGGLGGSVLTWYVNRPRPTVLTYRIATTTLSAPEAVGLIPDLKVLIAGKPIQALYAHNIELLPRQGPYIEQADVAFSFSSSVRVYGIHLESPSALHYLECSGRALKKTIQLPDATTEINAVRCTLKPIYFQASDTRPFRITIATDSSEIPRVLMAAKNVELVPADEFSPKERLSTSYLVTALAVLGGLCGCLFAFLYATFLEWRKAERTHQKDIERLVERLNKAWESRFYDKRP